MDLRQTIRRILREEKKTKSTNKEFVKYKDSKFHSLRDFTLQDIVDNWELLSDHKNDNIKTIKYFINNPDKITDLVYDEQGLEDGFHRLIAAKILKKPRFTYRMVENLQESIRRILREEVNTTNYIRRRYNCMDEYITKLENGEETLPIRKGQLDWTNYQIMITAFIRSNCEDDNGYYDPNLHSNIMDIFGDRLYQWYKNNIKL